MAKARTTLKQELFAVKQELLTSLHQDTHNANKGTERGSKALISSLDRLGAGRSILVDKNNRIIAGNKTAAAAGELGMDDVLIIESDGTRPVVVRRTDLDLEKDAKAKELAIADNRIGELGLDWDPDVLAGIGKTVDLSGLFSGDELAGILGEITKDLLGDEDDVPETPKKPVSKPGDVWILGDHRLMCGDSTNAGEVGRLMGGGLADCVWTDPPYNIDYTGKTKKALKIQNDAFSSAGAFAQFLTSAFAAMLKYARAGSTIYVAHADTEGLNFRSSLAASGWELHQCLVWVKDILVMGRSDYHWRHEPILYGWKPGAAHHWYSDRKQTTVLEFPRPARSEEHPTMKPVALVEYCIRNSSSPGQVVLDLFGGSGTTLLACEKLGRSARLMELSPAYADVIVTRWETATGKKAVRENNALPILAKVSPAKTPAKVAAGAKRTGKKRNASK